MNDDEEFGDDDWVAETDIQQLEQAALTSTQSATGGAARQPQTGSSQHNGSIQMYGMTGLSRNGNMNKGAWRPPQPRRTVPPPSAPEPPSSDYGFDDEDVIDLDEPSLVMQSTSTLPSHQRAQLPLQNPAAPARRGSRPPLDPETAAAFAAADAELGPYQLGAWAHAPHLRPQSRDGGDASGLQARIAELEVERAGLEQAEKEAKKTALAKQGEIAIVRANHDKVMKEYERRIAVMQKQYADEAAKQKAELEAGKKEREKMETDNRFLQHDLAQEAERTKRLHGASKGRLDLQEKSTPRKMKRTGLGDGFDDVEAHLASPSRSKEKSREQTPKAGNKRKRMAPDSPAASLVFAEPIREESMEQTPVVVDVNTAAERSRYVFMKRTLNHRPHDWHERSVETLSKYHFPSNIKESLSSSVLGSLTSPSSESETSMPLKLARTMLGLWRRCMEEEYYKPIYLIIDLTRFALHSELSDTIAQLIDEAVPLCVRSINLVTSAVFQALNYPSFASSTEYDITQKSVVPYIDVDEILEFLQQLCDAAVLSPQHHTLFWQTLDFKSVLLWLSRAQPMSQIITSLHILATSITPTSFGCLANPTLPDSAQAQVQQEHSIIERLTSMLFEMPRPPQDEPPYTDTEILEFRLEVLAVLKALCQYDHGGLQLAQYRTAIGRMIRFLDAQVCRLYTTPPALGLETVTTGRHPHTLVADTVNTTVRLVYHLLRAHSETINLQQRLAVFKGGWHKFLISMTRIAFSDRLVFEEGLEEESVEAAHQILDGVLSPEEGEAVMRAVETPRGTKGTLTEKDTESEGGGAMDEEPG